MAAVVACVRSRASQFCWWSEGGQLGGGSGGSGGSGGGRGEQRTMEGVVGGGSSIHGDDFISSHRSWVCPCLFSSETSAFEIAAIISLAVSSGCSNLLPPGTLVTGLLCSPFFSLLLSTICLLSPPLTPLIIAAAASTSAGLERLLAATTAHLTIADAETKNPENHAATAAAAASAKPLHPQLPRKLPLLPPPPQPALSPSAPSHEAAANPLSAPRPSGPRPPRSFPPVTRLAVSFSSSPLSPDMNPPPPTITPRSAQSLPSKSAPPHLPPPPPPLSAAARLSSAPKNDSSGRPAAGDRPSGSSLPKASPLSSPDLQRGSASLPINSSTGGSSGVGGGGGGSGAGHEAGSSSRAAAGSLAKRDSTGAAVKVELETGRTIGLSAAKAEAAAERSAFASSAAPATAAAAAAATLPASDFLFGAPAAAVAIGPTGLRSQDSHLQREDEIRSIKQTLKKSKLCLDSLESFFAALCRLDRSSAARCRSAIASERVFPVLALHLTVDFLHDELEFLLHHLGADVSSSHWLWKHFASMGLPPSWNISPNSKTSAAGSLDLSSCMTATWRVWIRLHAKAKQIWQESKHHSQLLFNHLCLFCRLLAIAAGGGEEVGRERKEAKREGKREEKQEEKCSGIFEQVLFWSDVISHLPAAPPTSPSCHFSSSSSTAKLVAPRSPGQAFGSEIHHQLNLNAASRLHWLQLAVSLLSLSPLHAAPLVPALKSVFRRVVLAPLEARQRAANTPSAGLGACSGSRNEKQKPERLEIETESSDEEVFAVWVATHLLQRNFGPIAALVKHLVSPDIRIPAAAFHYLVDLLLSTLPIASLPSLPQPSSTIPHNPHSTQAVSPKSHSSVVAAAAAAIRRCEPIIATEEQAHQEFMSVPEMLLASLNLLITSSILDSSLAATQASVCHVIHQASLPIHPAIFSLVSSFCDGIEKALRHSSQASLLHPSFRSHICALLAPFCRKAEQWAQSVHPASSLTVGLAASDLKANQHAARASLSSFLLLRLLLALKNLEALHHDVHMADADWLQWMAEVVPWRHLRTVVLQNSGLFQPVLPAWQSCASLVIPLRLRSFPLLSRRRRGPSLAAASLAAAAVAADEGNNDRPLGAKSGAICVQDVVDLMTPDSSSATAQDRWLVSRAFLARRWEKLSGSDFWSLLPTLVSISSGVGAGRGQKRKRGAMEERGEGRREGGDGQGGEEIVERMNKGFEWGVCHDFPKYFIPPMPDLVMLPFVLLATPPPILHDPVSLEVIVHSVLRILQTINCRGLPLAADSQSDWEESGGKSVGKPVGDVGEDGDERSSGKNSLMAVHAGVAQLLLELMLEIEVETDRVWQKEDCFEVLGSAIRLLLDNDEVKKLVHRQGYDVQLVPLLIRWAEGNRWMANLDLILSLLKEDTEQKRALGVAIAVHVSHFQDSPDSEFGDLLTHIVQMVESHDVKVSSILEIPQSMSALCSCAERFPSLATFVSQMLRYERMASM